jgi:hypothetical protein
MGHVFKAMTSSIEGYEVRKIPAGEKNAGKMQVDITLDSTKLPRENKRDDYTLLNKMCNDLQRELNSEITDGSSLECTLRADLVRRPDIRPGKEGKTNPHRDYAIGIICTEDQYKSFVKSKVIDPIIQKQTNEHGR